MPATALTPFVFERAGERADSVAFVDAPSGRSVTYGELDAASRDRALDDLVPTALAAAEEAAD